MRKLRLRKVNWLGPHHAARQHWGRHLKPSLPGIGTRAPGQQGVLLPYLKLQASLALLWWALTFLSPLFPSLHWFPPPTCGWPAFLSGFPRWPGLPSLPLYPVHQTWVQTHVYTWTVSIVPPPTSCQLQCTPPLPHSGMWFGFIVDRSIEQVAWMIWMFDAKRRTHLF